MENLSILKLFSSSLKTEGAKAASSSSADSSSLFAGKTKNSESGFEDVFRSYLDKSGQASAGSETQSAQTASAKSEKQTKTAESAVVSENGTAEKTETPESIIDGLDIDEDVKAELKKLLAQIENQEDAEEFMQQLMAAMQTAGMTFEQAETALTDLAASLLDGASEVIPEKSSPVLLEKVLDNIAMIMDEEPEPEALFTIPEPVEKVISFLEMLVKETAPEAEEPQTEEPTAEEETTAVKTALTTEEIPDENNGNTAAQQNINKETDRTKITLNDNGSAAAEKTEDSMAEDAPEQNTDMTEEFMTDMDDAAAEKVHVIRTETQDHDGAGFSLKTAFTEKVITTEIKIEKPADIMKFAELVEIAKNQNVNKISVQLNPVELGKVHIELTETAGKITGKVTFESESAKNLFTANLDAFKHQLAEKGITVENLEFLFKDFDQHEFAGWENGEKKNGSSKSASGSGGVAGTDEETVQEADNSAVYA